MEARNKQQLEAMAQVTRQTSGDLSFTRILSQNRLPLGIDMEQQQEQILSNFDTFLKIAGSELGALRSVAR